MKKTFKIFLTIVCSLLIASCNLDVNNDPNRVTNSNVTGALIFPAAAHETGQRVATGNYAFLNKWLGWWASSGTFAIDFTETTYNITPTFADALWQSQYNVLFDLEQARSKSLAAGDTSTAGASIILSAMLWQDLVDVYENIPYSQALHYTTYPQPSYDNGQAVYDDLQSKLDLAISFMGKQSLSSFAQLDIVNKGNKAKWVKFANTLKLRLLIRQSEISGFNPTAELAKIVANGGVLQSGETVSVNPGYTKATNQQSPFYANFGLTINGSEASPSTRANDYFTALVTDGRLTRYFIPVNGKVVGDVYGEATGNPLVSSGVGPGLANSDTQNQWILTSIESLFLEAEAIERGWLQGSASTKYNQAVTESFNWLGVSDASNAATAYLRNFPYQAGNVKNILLEKYKALCGIAPVQLWSDLRRMGYDIIPSKSGSYQWFTLNPSVNPKIAVNTLPARMLIAQSEYTTNSENANLQTTDITKKMFWQP
jgi:hypothetical protein